MNNLRVGDSVSLKLGLGGIINHAYTNNGGIISSLDKGIVIGFDRRTYCEFIGIKGNFLAPRAQVDYPNGRITLFTPAFKKIKNK